MEAVASNEGLYASALIREVMEALVVTRESHLADDEDESDSLEAKLRSELIALNENLIKIGERREQIQSELVRQMRKREDGFVDDDVDCDEGLPPDPEDEDFGFDSDPIE